MRKVFLKLRSRGGESFAEILVAILIVAMAALLMAAMVSASGGLDARAVEADKEFYEAMQNVEGISGEVSGSFNMTITDGVSSRSADVSVKVYSDKDPDGTLYRYEVT